MEGWHGVRFSRAGADDPGDDRDRPHGEPRRAAGARRRGLPAAAARQRRQALVPLVAPAARAGLRRRDGAGEPAPHRRAGRRLARQRLRPRSRRGSSSARSREGAARPGGTLDRPRPGRPGRASSSPTTTADGRRPRSARTRDGYAFTIGAMGSGAAQLLQRRLHPARVRRRGRRGRAAVAGRAARRGRAPPCRSTSAA